MKAFDGPPCFARLPRWQTAERIDRRAVSVRGFVTLTERNFSL